MNVEDDHKSHMGKFLRNTSWNSDDPFGSLNKILELFRIKNVFTENSPNEIRVGNKGDSAAYYFILSPHASPFRRFWNKAHMLGHVMMHYIDIWYIFNQGLVYSCHILNDEYAEFFAMDLLLPKKEVVEYYNKVDGNFNLIRGYFCVPKEKLEKRLTELNLEIKPYF